jgi:hypothetical protein
VILRVIAIESIEPLALVSLLFNDSNQISCRESLPSEPPDAIARRQIANGESVTFDSGQDTDDLLRPRTAHYDPYPPRWLVTNRHLQHGTHVRGNTERGDASNDKGQTTG